MMACGMATRPIPMQPILEVLRAAGAPAATSAQFLSPRFLSCHLSFCLILGLPDLSSSLYTSLSSIDTFSLKIPQRFLLSKLNSDVR